MVILNLMVILYGFGVVCHITIVHLYKLIEPAICNHEHNHQVLFQLFVVLAIHYVCVISNVYAITKAYV